MTDRTSGYTGGARRGGQGRRRRRAEVILRHGDAARDQRRELQHLKALRDEHGVELEGAKDGVLFRHRKDRSGLSGGGG